MRHHHDHDPLALEPGESLNEAFLGHAMTPQNVGILPNPSGYAMPKGACGDYMELYLNIEDGQVTDARFMTEGCLHTVACGSALTTLIKGLPLAQAAQVGSSQIDEELGGLPREHKHCAALAAATLKAAIRDHVKRRQAPWKSLYSKG